MTCAFAHDDGAYVLGALAPGERSAFENHLTQCAACRENVAGIAVLPGLLRRLNQPEALEPLIETPDRMPALLIRAGVARRRQVRWRRLQAAFTALAVACVLLAAGFGAMIWRNTPPAPSGPVLAPMSLIATESKVSAEVGFAEVPGGLQVIMHCSYPDNGTTTHAYTFRLVAIGADGTVEQVSSWLAGPGDEVRITGTVRFRLSDVERFELRSRDGTPLLVYEVS